MRAVFGLEWEGREYMYRGRGFLLKGCCRKKRCVKHVLFLRILTFFCCVFAQSLSMTRVTDILVFDTAIKAFNTDFTGFDTVVLFQNAFLLR